MTWRAPATRRAFGTAPRRPWGQDRRREREARARGDEFRRYTHGDVFEHPEEMLAELRALLPHHGPA